MVRQLTKEEVFTAFGLPEEMVKHIKDNERENEVMYLNWLKNNGTYLIGVDLANKPDLTVST